MTPDVPHYWHTFRHLRARQVIGRVRLLALPSSPEVGPAPRRRPCGAGRFVTPARRDACVIDGDRFCLLGETRGLGAHGWDDPGVEKLWRYHLHYFDDLNADGADGRAALHEALLSRWVRENPPGRGTGWEPFPTSRRIVNWIAWALRGHALSPACLESLANQARWLLPRIEEPLLGNHLLANAKALAFAGLFFEGPESDRWLARGVAVLARELEDQILADGGHVELSPMYHAVALEDLLDLRNLQIAYGDGVETRWAHALDRLAARVPAMRRWLGTMCHPDGEIAFFNDAAMGIAPAPSEIDRYARDLGFGPADPPSIGVTDLADSGYIRVGGRRLVAILDVARIGLDYQPAHAHADTLSFECSLDGHRLLVNSGTSCYGSSDERLRQRGTAAHNTVVIAGLDSSEVWGGFRVARRARPRGLRVTQGRDVVVACAHDGYRRLKGRPVHSRQWAFSDGALVIDDTVTGPPAVAHARFHVHPDVRVESGPHAREGRLHLPSGRVARWRIEIGHPAIVAATYHPRFGTQASTRCLVNQLAGGSSRVRFEWE
jgi:uncharacterized heparinase superfamily protein